MNTIVVRTPFKLIACFQAQNIIPPLSGLSTAVASFSNDLLGVFVVELLAVDKSILRNEFLTARAAITGDQVAAASAAVCRHLAAWNVFRPAGTVMAYLAFGNEISLQSLLDGHPEKRWVLPRTLPAGRLTLHRYQPGRLVRHRFGMLEPPADAPLVAADEIELVLVPGVGFDRCGGRMGFGAGYYDRLLPHLNAVRVGVAYRLFQGDIPCEEHDCRMDYLALPDGIVRC